MMRMRLLGVVCGLLICCAVSSTYAADDTDLTECAERVASQILLVPADVSARPSRLRELLAQVERDTKVLEGGSDKELVARATRWITGLTLYLASTDNGTDNLLPGFPVVGLTPTVESVSAAETSRFETLLTRIARIPETVPNETLDSLLSETTRDIEILGTRNSPEDEVLIRRAKRWLAALQSIKASGGNAPDAADDVGFTLDYSVLDGGDVVDGEKDGYSQVSPENDEIPKSDFEAFLEIARDPVLEELQRLVLSKPELRRKIALGPGKDLADFRDQMILLSDDPGLLAVVDVFALTTLKGKIRNDPFSFGARLDDYKIYVREAEFYLSRLEKADAPSPQQLAVRGVAKQWIAAAKQRIEQEDEGDPKKALDGPSLLGLGRFGGFVLGGGGGVPRFVPPMMDIQEFLTAESALAGLTEAFDPKVTALPPVVAHLIEMVRGASLFSRAYERNLAALQGGRAEASLRDQVVALVKEEELRRLLAEIAEEEFLARSDAEAKKAEKGPRKVDVLVVGAGLHEQHVQNAFTQLAPGLDSLALEVAENVASTFDQGGYAVSLNSTLRAPNTSNLRQMLSSDTMEGGDLNYLLGGVVQLNQFEKRQNPVLKSMAQGIQINRLFSKGGIRLKTGADGVEFLGRVPGNENGLYNFRTIATDGSEVWARAMIATGIGKSTVPAISGFREAYQTALEQFALDPNLPPRLMRPEDIYRFILNSRNPYRPFSQKRVGVAGPGDTGKAVVRWLLLGSDPRSYGDDTRSVAKVGVIPWFGQSAETCDAFISGNRSFYADLGRGYRSNTIQSRDKLKSVDLRLDGMGVIESVIADRDPVMKIGEELDYLVVATGYESQLGRILRPITGDLLVEDSIRDGSNEPAPLNPNEVIEQEQLFRFVYGYEPTLGRVPIARQLINPETGQAVPFYVAGPAAGRIVTPEELRQVDENYVANTNHNWRVWLLAQAVAAQLVSQDASLSASPPETSPASAKPLDIESATQPETPLEFTLERNGGEENVLAGDELLFAARFFTLLEEYDLSSLQAIEVRFAFREEAGDEDRFAVRFDPPLGAAEAVLVERIRSNQPLRNTIISMIGRNARNREIELEFTVQGPTIIGSESGVSMKRRPSF